MHFRIRSIMVHGSTAAPRFMGLELVHGPVSGCVSGSNIACRCSVNKYRWLYLLSKDMLCKPICQLAYPTRIGAVSYPYQYPCLTRIRLPNWSIWVTWPHNETVFISNGERVTRKLESNEENARRRINNGHLSFISPRWRWGVVLYRMF